MSANDESRRDLKWNRVVEGIYAHPAIHHMAAEQPVYVTLVGPCPDCGANRVYYAPLPKSADDELIQQMLDYQAERLYMQGYRCDECLPGYYQRISSLSLT